MMSSRTFLTACCLLALPAFGWAEAPEQFELAAPLQELVSTVDAEPTSVSPNAGISADMPSFREPGAWLTLGGYVEPSNVARGETAQLVITAIPDKGAHVYPYADLCEVNFNKPTLIVIDEALSSGRAATDAPVIAKPPVLAGGPPNNYHPGNVTWAVDIHVPDDAPTGPQRIEGWIGYQTCTDSSCDKPRGATFSAEIMVAETGGVPPGYKAPVHFQAGRYDDAATAAEQRANRGDWPATIERTDTDLVASNSPARPDKATSIPYILATAFAAGLILNVMPCVLPVIGLKIMAFVQQAGESRWRVFELNLWYSLGLMSVFMLLALAAVTAGLGWGEQFSSTLFNLILLCVVFVFGLAMLGVWEVPIPGFLGSGAAVDAAEKEGRFGAFTKGALTTVLATPCTGPLLGPALAWATQQPASLTYTTFAMVGLGMASPYLLIGAFPNLIAFLPKPGAWMNTFKQLMGFILMGTVVFIFSFLEEDYIVGALAMLVGLGFACWWIGRTSFTATWGQKLVAWLVGGSVATVTAVVMFYALPKLELYELEWQPFTRTALEEHLAEGRTVLVDFTADW